MLLIKALVVKYTIPLGVSLAFSSLACARVGANVFANVNSMDASREES